MNTTYHGLDLIYEHSISKGKIYQCGALEIPGVAKTLNIIGYIHSPIVIEGLNHANISIIALTAKSFQPRLEGFNVDVIHIPFSDKADLSDSKIAKIERMITSAAYKMAKAVEQGQNVLSTCWGGLNRSSLLTACIIKNLEAWGNGQLNPQEVIRKIKTQRSERCLNNKLFEKIVINGF